MYLDLFFYLVANFAKDIVGWGFSADQSDTGIWKMIYEKKMYGSW